jgi:hypothetical protein
MPSEYLRNKSRMEYLTSVDAEIDYRDSLAERATVGGDRHLEEDVPAKYSGVAVVPIHMMPQVLGGAGTETVVLLTDPKNIHYGIWRQIRFEVDKDISAGVLVIVATLRFDVKYAEETAVVKATGVTVS